MRGDKIERRKKSDEADLKGLPKPLFNISVCFSWMQTLQSIYYLSSGLWKSASLQFNICERSIFQILTVKTSKVLIAKESTTSASQNHRYLSSSSVEARHIGPRIQNPTPAKRSSINVSNRFGSGTHEFQDRRCTFLPINVPSKKESQKLVTPCGTCIVFLSCLAANYTIRRYGGVCSNASSTRPTAAWAHPYED